MRPFPPAALRVLNCRGIELNLSRPRIMGIVNTSPDSFHADSRTPALDVALAHARRLVSEGADLLDIGGQSTRPGYVEISEAEEISRTAPLIAALAQEFPALPLSIDTYKPAVAAAALAAGAHVLNDIHGLQGPGGPALAQLAATSGAALVVMHNDPALRDAPADADPVHAVREFLRRSLRIAANAGVAKAATVIDPGIGFAKTQPQNVELLRRLDELHQLDAPVLLGISRKSVFGHILPELATPDLRLEATLAATALAVSARIQIHRVHDVRAARLAALTAAALSSPN